MQNYSRFFKHSSFIEFIGYDVENFRIDSFPKSGQSPVRVWLGFEFGLVNKESHGIIENRPGTGTPIQHHSSDSELKTYVNTELSITLS